MVAAGHRRLPAIRSARAARASASAAVAGHIGLKLYHWSGAALMIRSRAAATACDARWRSAGLLDGTLIGWSSSTRKWSLAWRRMAIGRIVAPVFAARAAGPGGEGGPGPEQADRDAVVAIAPVDEQGQQLVPAEDAVDLAQVAPGDHVDAPRLALAAEDLEQLGKRRVVGDHRDRPAPLGHAGRHDLVVADVADHQDHALRRSPVALHAVQPVAVDQGGGLRLAEPGQAHQLDEVAGIRGVGAQGQAADRRAARRLADHVPEVGVRPAPLRRPEQVRRPGEPADDRPRRAGGQPGEEPRAAPIEQDARSLHDPGALGRPAVGCLEAVGRRLAAGSRPPAVGHRSPSWRMRRPSPSIRPAGGRSS